MNETDDAGEFFAWMFVAIVGLAGVRQLWETKIRPWIDTQLGATPSSDGVAVPALGTLDSTDVIGLLALAIPLLLVIVVCARALRRRRRSAAAAKGESRTESKGRR